MLRSLSRRVRGRAPLAAVAAVAVLCGGALAACAKSNSGAQGTGTQYFDLNLPSPDVTACWEASSERPADLREIVEETLLREINGRTNVRIVFTPGACAGPEIVRYRFLSGKRAVEGCSACPGTAGLTEYKDFGASKSRLVLLFHVAIREANYAQTGEALERWTRAHVAGTALHETLHALGLADEVLHPDVRAADPSCHAKYADHISNFRNQPAARGLAQPFRDLGGYDVHSIMNYCNPRKATLRDASQVTLSEGDVRALAMLYPTPGRTGAMPPTSTAKGVLSNTPDQGVSQPPQTGGAPQDGGALARIRHEG